VLAREWWEPEVGQLSQRSRQNLEKALGLEVNNTQFYRCSAELAGDMEARAMLIALSKIEAEHASTISKILGLPKPSIGDDPSACHPTLAENLTEAHEREESAVAFYGQSAEEAVEPRVKEVFTALVEIESDHITLSGDRL
jgi:rubrerythrin